MENWSSELLEAEIQAETSHSLVTARRHHQALAIERDTKVEMPGIAHQMPDSVPRVNHQIQKKRK